MTEQGEKGNDSQPPGPPADERSDPPQPPQSPPSRIGEPDPRTILAEKPYVSPKGNRYVIVETNELDPYEEPAQPAKPPDATAPATAPGRPRRPSG